MSLTTEALADTRHAFDGAAELYHEENAENPVLCEMRRRALEALTERVPPGSSLLDLGCGPGTDAERLGRSGYRVLAIDWSPEMAREAERRARAAGLNGEVEVRHLGIHELDRLGERVFDGIYSNLGPLNCVPDLGAAARRIAGRLSPGGVFVASAIGRICPWEILLYALRRDFSRAGIRFCSDFVPVPFRGRTIWTRYYDPRAFQEVFGRAGLETISLRALGVLVPPPYLTGFAKRHPKSIDLLQRIEDRVASWPGIRRLGDHFLIVMQKPS